MSKKTKTEAPMQKKNVGYKLLAALVFVACVAVLFLPISTFTGAWAIEKQTLIETIKAILASNTKMFGVLPVLVETTGILALSANVTMYAFAIAIVVAAILSLIAIFAKKKSPCLVRTALFFLIWGIVAYVVCMLFISRYVSTIAVTLDLYMAAAVLGCAFFYFILMLTKTGKSTWLNTIQIVFSIAVTYLFLFGMTFNSAAVSAAINANKLYKLMMLGIIAFAMLNLVIASLRCLSKKGLSFDMVRYVLQLLVALFACYVGYAAKIGCNTYLICCAIAAVVSVVQIFIATLQLNYRAKKKVLAEKDAALASFETEEYVEAYAYQGGPVAGVVIAEEVTPTAAAQAAAAQSGENAAQPEMSSLVGNGFDPFMFTLNDEEQAEFIDLYILRCKGAMPEIPTYNVGGDNKEFFNKVFIYLGQYREKISSALLAKMYTFSMKIS